MPESPKTLVPFVHELARYAGASQGRDPNLEVGAAYSARVESFKEAYPSRAAS